jgi:hypothetical protein
MVDRPRLGLGRPVALPYPVVTHGHAKRVGETESETVEWGAGRPVEPDAPVLA